MSFESLGLAAPILRSVTAEGYTIPTPIQAQAIPLVLEGHDLFGCAQTGTGKTAAFALPILHKLSAPPAQGQPAEKKPRRIRALILSPTRELAQQISDSFKAYGRNAPLRSTMIYGGVNQNPQVRALKAGVDIVVATPGRLLDLINQGYVDLRAVEMLVLDEADRMLDMGFLPDIRRIVAKLPQQRQTLLFSATMPDDIRQLANTILKSPRSVHVAPAATTAERIEQVVYFVAKRNKPALLKHLLRTSASGRTLVFTRTKHGADRVVKDLMKAGLKAAAIHGNKSQGARSRALAEFRSAAVPVLVATDIASRGIDVDEVSHVFNFDVPHEAETYVHRIGRTARAGASGKAVSFCDHDERGNLRAIERLIRQSIEVGTDQPKFAQADNGPAEKTAEGGKRPAGQKPGRKFGGHKSGGYKPGGYKSGGGAPSGRKPFFKKKSKKPVAAAASQG
ncbi:MAG: DEAD/DEAH box helicase [Pirellulales bacterium]